MVKSGKASSGLVVSEGTAIKSGPLQTGLSSPDFHLPFFHYMDIPKSTLVNSYLSYEMILPIGRINKIWIEYPDGCAGLVGFQLWRGVNQLFPLPSGLWLRSNNSTLSFSFTHFIDTEPYNVEFRAYNNDDTYNHTLWICLEMSGLPNELSSQVQGLLSVLKS